MRDVPKIREIGVVQMGKNNRPVCSIKFGRSFIAIYTNTHGYFLIPFYEVPQYFYSKAAHIYRLRYITIITMVVYRKKGLILLFFILYLILLGHVEHMVIMRSCIKNGPRDTWLLLTRPMPHHISVVYP